MKRYIVAIYESFSERLIGYSKPLPMDKAEELYDNLQEMFSSAQFIIHIDPEDYYVD